MKRIIVLVLLLSVIQIPAQERQDNRPKEGRKHHGEFMQNMTAEQLATLKTKRMTLDLNLNESQSQEIYNLNLKAAQDKKAKFEERKGSQGEGKRKELTEKEHFDLMNNRLDNQIAHKQRMQRILNEDQFKRWEMQSKRHSVKRQRKGNKRKGHPHARNRQRN